MKRKIRVGILFGGRSAEHEISLQSARNILHALDKKKYEPVLLGITKKGQWILGQNSAILLDSGRTKDTQKDTVALVPGDQKRSLVSTPKMQGIAPLDVVFPVLHGPLGEDGTIQGLLKLMDVPFVGAGVLGSAVGMDKDVMKRLLRDANIPTAKFLAFDHNSKINFSHIHQNLGTPLFVKPANMGSSVGVSKVSKKIELEQAIQTAFEYDSKILIEEFIKGREIECSVLGNENPIASVPGEIVPHHEFYSYEAKYTDPDGASLIIPAKLSHGVIKKVQAMALAAFKALCLEGMARVDFFLTKENGLILNEVNTIPGFTNISMYPKLWEASGISQKELVDRLIRLAIERYTKENKLKNSLFL